MDSFIDNLVLLNLLLLLHHHVIVIPLLLLHRCPVLHRAHHVAVDGRRWHNQILVVLDNGWRPTRMQSLLIVTDEWRHPNRWIGVFGGALQVGMLIGLLLSLRTALILEGFMIVLSAVLSMSAATPWRWGNVSEPATVAGARRTAIISVISRAAARFHCTFLLYLHVRW